MSNSRGVESCSTELISGKRNTKKGKRTDRGSHTRANEQTAEHSAGTRISAHHNEPPSLHIMEGTWIHIPEPIYPADPSLHVDTTTPSHHDSTHQQTAKLPEDSTTPSHLDSTHKRPRVESHIPPRGPHTYACCGAVVAGSIWCIGA